MDQLRKVGVLGGLLGCKLWCYGYLWLLCPANQGHYGTLIRNTIFFTTRRLGLPSCWGSWNLPCRSSWIPPWTSAAKEAPRWRACARGELLLDLHDMSTVSVIRCHRRSPILCNCSLVLHGFAWFCLLDWLIGWYWLILVGWEMFFGHLTFRHFDAHISHISLVPRRWNWLRTKFRCDAHRTRPAQWCGEWLPSPAVACKVNQGETCGTMWDCWKDEGLFVSFYGLEMLWIQDFLQEFASL